MSKRDYKPQNTLNTLKKNYMTFGVAASVLSVYSVVKEYWFLKDE